MAFLLAVFGPIDPTDWVALAQEAGGCDVSQPTEWHESDGSVRLASLDMPEATASSTQASGDLAATVVGRVAGEVGARAALQAYRERGIGGLASLRGEYAFALWDRQARALFVGCDAVGLRAPAYCWDGRTFLVSTRAIALLRHPGVPRAWDEAYLGHALLGTWSRATAATAFENVRRLGGGDLLRVTARGVERLTGPRLAFPPRGRCHRDLAARALGAHIDRAVREGPQRGARCLALSGGLDSCVVATSLVSGQPDLDAFSLLAPDGSPGDSRDLRALLAEFPAMRHHRIPLPDAHVDPLCLAPLPDDPIWAAPLLQPGRLALVRALRGRGFRHVFDGEGGDEIFDIAWGLADLVREAAFGSIVLAMGLPASRRRMVRDLVLGSRGPAANLLLQRAKGRARARRPWLRDAFWGGSSFGKAWEELAALARRPNARARLPEVLGVYGRHWRAQDLMRQSVGVESSSPFLGQTVVEFVGGLRASVAIEPGHAKALLRHLAAARVSESIAWRPKTERLNDWLIAGWISQDANVARTVSRIKSSRLLCDVVDTTILVAAVDAARRVRGPSSWASSIVELGALAEWVTAVEERYRL